MNNIVFPTTTDQLRQALQCAIEHYQGSPVKNANKLNECLAKSLGFANYDQLAAQLHCHEDPSTNAYTTNVLNVLGKRYMEIKDVSRNTCIIIDDELADDGHLTHVLADREDRVITLREWIGEASRAGRTYDVAVMEADLETLKKSDDEYVLEAYGTNGFVAGDTHPQEFNQICDDIIEHARNHYNALYPTSKSGALYPYAHVVPANGKLIQICEVYEGEMHMIPDQLFSGDVTYLVGSSVIPFDENKLDEYTAVMIDPNDPTRYIAVGIDC